MDLPVRRDQARMWQLSEILDALRLRPSAHEPTHPISYRPVATGAATGTAETGPSSKGLGRRPEVTDTDCLRIRCDQDTAYAGPYDVCRALLLLHRSCGIEPGRSRTPTPLHVPYSNYARRSTCVARVCPPTRLPTSIRLSHGSGGISTAPGQTPAIRSHTLRDPSRAALHKCIASDHEPHAEYQHRQLSSALPYHCARLPLDVCEEAKPRASVGRGRGRRGPLVGFTPRRPHSRPEDGHTGHHRGLGGRKHIFRTHLDSMSTTARPRAQNGVMGATVRRARRSSSHNA